MRSGTQKKGFVLFFGFGYFRRQLPGHFDLKFSVLVLFVRLKVPFGSGKRPSFVPSRGKFSICICFAQYLLRCSPACPYNGVPLYWCHFKQACVCYLLGVLFALVWYRVSVVCMHRCWCFKKFNFGWEWY